MAKGRNDCPVCLTETHYSPSNPTIEFEGLLRDGETEAKERPGGNDTGEEDALQVPACPTRVSLGLAVSGAGAHRFSDQEPAVTSAVS